jgi:hypothetical protein
MFVSLVRNSARFAPGDVRARGAVPVFTNICKSISSLPARGSVHRHRLKVAGSAYSGQWELETCNAKSSSIRSKTQAEQQATSTKQIDGRVARWRDLPSLSSQSAASHSVVPEPAMCSVNLASLLVQVQVQVPHHHATPYTAPPWVLGECDRWMGDEASRQRNVVISAGWLKWSLAPDDRSLGI